MTNMHLSICLFVCWRADASDHLFFFPDLLHRSDLLKSSGASATREGAICSILREIAGWGADRGDN